MESEKKLKFQSNFFTKQETGITVEKKGEKRGSTKKKGNEEEGSKEGRMEGNKEGRKVDSIQIREVFSTK